MDAAIAPPGEVRTGADVQTGEQSRDEGLKPADIDAYWLQRNITKAYGSLDENEAVRKTEEVFNALQVSAFLANSEPQSECKAMMCCESGVRLHNPLFVRPSTAGEQYS